MHEFILVMNRTDDNIAGTDNRPRSERVIGSFQSINDIVKKTMPEFFAQQKVLDDLKEQLCQKVDLETSSQTASRGLINMLEQQVQKLNEAKRTLWEDDEALSKEIRKLKLKERLCGGTSIGASDKREEETRDSETKEKKKEKGVFSKEQ